MDFESDAGAKADVSDLASAWKNGGILNDTLQALSPGDILVVPNKTFHVMGGIQVHNLTSVTISLDGTLSFLTM